MNKRSNNSILMQIGLLAALASVLQLAESCIPMPFPGMKVGFANLITLIAIVSLGTEAGLSVALLRTIVSSLLLGTFLSSGFILSFSGAMSSALVMAAMYTLNKKLKLFSLIGISVMGAVANNSAQLLVVYYLFTRVTALQWFFPYLMLSALVTGYLTGFIASRICRKLGRHGKAVSFFGDCEGQMSFKKAGASQITSTSASSIINFLAIGCGFFAALIISDPVILASFIVISTVISVYLLKITYAELFRRFRRLFPYMLFVFVVNVIGKSAGSGALTGLTACLRLLSLLLLAFLIDKGIPRDELIYLLSRLARPLEFFGIKTKGLIGQLSFSFDAVPFFSEAISYRFRLLASGNKRRKNFKYIAAYITTALIFLLKGEPDTVVQG